LWQQAENERIAAVIFGKKPIPASPEWLLGARADALYHALAAFSGVSPQNAEAILQRLLPVCIAALPGFETASVYRKWLSGEVPHCLHLVPGEVSGILGLNTQTPISEKLSQEDLQGWWKSFLLLLAFGLALLLWQRWSG
jgi:hypothetical protein